MANQPIEIDTAAYQRLEQVRRAEESVSEVILRCVKPPKSAEEILQALREADLSSNTLDAIEDSVARRRSTPRTSRK
jgi:predicted CopG family antitoxin